MWAMLLGGTARGQFTLPPPPGQNLPPPSPVYSPRTTSAPAAPRAIDPPALPMSIDLSAPVSKPTQPTFTPARPAPLAPLTSTPLSQPDGQEAGQILPVGGVQPPQRREEEFLDYKIQLTPPGPERLFRLESEGALLERMRQEARRPGSVDRIVFPEQVALSKDYYGGRAWARMQEIAEPNYVVFKRTYFDQINSERYGWDMGPLQPLVSASVFAWDLAWLPYHVGTEPLRRYESNAGYYQPGDPAPFLLYPPTFSLTGLAAQGAAVTSGFVFFP